VTNKYNQFVAARMREEQSDLSKLIKLASLIRRKYGIKVDREPILLFDTQTYHLVKVADWITKDEYAHHIIHCPDIVFYTDRRWILEDDGLIHHTNTHVARKDKLRNDHYSTAKLNHIIIDEFELIERFGMMERPLNPFEVFTEFERIAEERKIFSKNYLF